jgi:hypothetical protein
MLLYSIFSKGDAMEFLFVSRDCPSCQAVMIMLEDLKKTNSWTYDVTIVDVKFDVGTATYRAIINGEDTGESPVETVPTYFSPERNILWHGTVDIIQGFSDGNNKSKS